MIKRNLVAPAVERGDPARGHSTGRRLALPADGETVSKTIRETFHDRQSEHGVVSDR